MTVRKRLFVIILGSVLGAVLVYYAAEIIIARIKAPRITTGILQSDGIRLQFSDLSTRRLEILLSVEDPDFFNHRGVDLKTPGAGLTTITQSLVKKLYFKNFKPGVRKIKQTLIARFALDPLVSKEDQLVIFINTFDFCYETRGFAEASEFYYGKAFSELSEDEYISLVAMCIGCGSYNLIHNAERNAERVARIKKLLSGEYIPMGMKDIYYGDEMDAFRWRSK
jgi:membrane carboxypeptidase/penicillin-binding protein